MRFLQHQRAECGHGLGAGGLPRPAQSGPGGTGLLASVMQTVRMMVSGQIGCARLETEPVHSLDAHMLSDIGLQADSVWRDPPRGAWPH